MKRNTSARNRLSYRLSLYLGNLFEHYDTGLYACLSPLFASLFFPDGEYVNGLLATLIFIPLGRIVSPLGAFFFGYIGDTRGRRQALCFSLLGMAITTCLIAFLPTYSEIGWWAPTFLLFVRICQSFFGAGEVIGGAVHLLETCETEKRKDLVSSFWGTSTISGILVASFAVSLLYQFGWVERGWRFLYLAGAFTALIGAVVRTRVPSGLPIGEREYLLERLRVFWSMRHTAFTIGVAAGFSYSTYALATALMVGFIPLISEFTRAEVSVTNTYLLVLDFFLLPLFGLLALFVPRTKSMIVAAFSAFFLSLPLAQLLVAPDFWTLLTVRIAFIVIGVWFSATFHSWAQDLVPKEYRYMIISVAYSLGSQLFGGVTPAISLWLYKQTGVIASITLYWALLALATGCCMVREKWRQESLSTMSAV